ncbi:hypothetical protein PCASD_21222 [Puccinia coronata f. sp. avenae]|uniref:Uncharacterized protein n=1 Tax=Puccinia coronata f. sp. avenae TaxID=200324 RepID=A0A2N5SDW6_9BASI|nr:hypothetical protein PCASD_21222 [Puccinia coronata f. sp. avenae]
MPPFRGWAENHSAAGNFQSSQAGLEEVFSPTSRLVNKKRPPETLPNHQYRLDLPGFDTHWANYAVPDGSLEVQHGDGMMSNVAKRQKTVQNGYSADHVPDGLGSDAFSLTGPTHQPMFKPVTITDHELHRLDPSSVSASQASPWPHPSHDAAYHGSMDFEGEHTHPLTHDAMFQSISPYQLQTPDDDHTFSQVLAQWQSSDFANINEWPELSFLNHVDQEHPFLPVSESIPGRNLGHGPQKNSPLVKDSYGSQGFTQLGAPNQVQSHQQFDESVGFPSVSKSHSSLWPYPSHGSPYSSIEFEGENSNLLTQDAMFQSVSTYKPQAPDDDITFSQVLEQLQPSDLTNFNAQDHSPIIKHSHGAQASAQPESQVQIQSHQPSEDHTLNRDSTAIPFNLGPITSESSTTHPSGDLFQNTNKNGEGFLKESPGGARFDAIGGHSPVFNKSPSDNEDRPVHKSLMSDSDLGNLRFPKNSLNKDLLNSHVSKFIEEVSKIFLGGAHGTFKVEHALTDHHHVTVFKIPKSGLYHIRINGDNDPTDGKPRAKNPSIESFRCKFNQLVQWLLLVNTTIWRTLKPTQAEENAELKPTQAEENAEFKFNEELIDSLFKEAFHPNKGLPILGPVKPEIFDTIPVDEAFGQIQKDLIEYLSSRYSSRKALSAALSFIYCYYQGAKPEIWDALGIRNLVQLYPLAERATFSGINIISHGVSEPIWANKLGDFSIRKLQDLPDSLKPSNPGIKSQWDFPVTLGTKGNQIRTYFESLFANQKVHRKNDRQLAFEPDDFPVMIYQAGKDEDGRPRGLVWLKIDGITLKREATLIRIKSLLGSLKMCFSELMGYMKTQSKLMEHNMEDVFFQWIHDALRNPGNDKLPVMGNFVLGDGRGENPIFTLSDFGEVQIFLIRILSDTTSYSRNIQVALALIGYWLKNERRSVYTQLFQNDETYWDTLINLLTAQYNVSGTRTSRQQRYMNL